VRTAGKRVGWGDDVARILSLLVCSRVVWPCSKKAAVERAPLLLGGPDVDLARVYPALDHIAALTVALQQAASAGLGRSKTSLRTVDYDVTNYFFHIDHDDADPRTPDIAAGLVAEFPYGPADVARGGRSGRCLA
jgi:hypothetical protein